jgi:hypothetical protein
MFKYKYEYCPSGKARTQWTHAHKHTQTGRNIGASLETADLFTRNNQRHRPAARTIDLIP